MLTSRTFFSPQLFAAFCSAKSAPNQQKISHESTNNNQKAGPGPKPKKIFTKISWYDWWYDDMVIQWYFFLWCHCRLPLIQGNKMHIAICMDLTKSISIKNRAIFRQGQHRRIQTWTCRRVDASTLQRVEASTCPHVHVSTLRHIDASTHRCVNASTRQGVEVWMRLQITHF